MTTRILLLAGLLLVAACSNKTKIKRSSMRAYDSSQDAKTKWVIVVHGGAGTIPKNVPDSIKQAYINGLTEAIKIGKNIVENGGTAMDAVEKVINHLEDDPHFNAGRGAVYTSEGTHEMDACIMDGRTLDAGAVAGVSTVKNPISLARLVMEKTPHVLLAYDGAETFAREMGVTMEPPAYFDTKRRKEQLERAQGKSTALLDNPSPAVTFDEHKMGTVGCVILDTHGNLAAGTSTGGLTNKMPGRIGDSPIPGAGTYANNATCAISGTGIGEKFIRHNVAYDISALMQYKGLSLMAAADTVIHHKLKPGDGGVIGVSRNGDYTMTFNTQGMFRAVATSGGIQKVGIWEKMSGFQ